MIYLDYNVRNINLSNGGTQTYTLPYKALIVVGNIRPDEQESLTIYVRSDNVVDSRVDGSYIYLTRHDGDNVFNRLTVNVGSYVAVAGDIIIMQTNDDCAFDLHIFRLPESA